MAEENKIQEATNKIVKEYQKSLKKNYIRHMIIGWETAMVTLDKYMSKHTYKETKAYVKHCLSPEGKKAMEEAATKKG